VFCIASAGLSETWTGLLVDSRCWMSRQTNVSSDVTTPGRDMALDVRACSPTLDTKKFLVVLYDWRALRLDPKGNVRAAQLAREGKSRPGIHVSVKGVLKRRTILATSISPF
jgi:hypothetical protein